MMMRNIVGQTIYQTVILLVVVLNCDRFFEIDCESLHLPLECF